MKKLKKIFKPAPLLALFLVITLKASGAPARTVYFNATGVNRTTKGLGTATASTCKITLSNPSSTSQDYVMAITATSKDAFTGGAAVVSNATGASGAGCSVAGAVVNCSGTLTAGGSATGIITYTAFTAGAVGSAAGYQNGNQQLRCSGSIKATDSTATPGFMIASGVLVTFVESTEMQTQNTSSGAAVNFGGTAVFTQVPIAINRSKPF
ncbi:MAG TPA: hypothetical protein VIH99_10225 [Bdellovibrionota bacterium]|jgi:hypothetical protein